MDQLKGFANKLASGSSSNTNTGGNNAAPMGGSGTTGGPADNAGREDYLDKGFDAAGKKFGYQGNRETNEKITDTIRTKFEGTTGKHVPEKFSN